MSLPAALFLLPSSGEAYNATMERFIPLFAILGWFGAIFAASYLINWLLVRSIIRHHYRFFVAPGVIVHELSHALGCLMTGAQILEINFWKASGGHVKHMQPVDPMRRMISDPIIALAPIWGTLLLLAFLTWMMFPEVIEAIQMNDLTAVTTAIDLRQWQGWLYLYLVTSLLATVAPSATDMRYALESLVILALLLVVLSFIPGFPDLLSSVGTYLRPFALFTLGLMALGIFIAFLLALPYRHKHFVPRNQLE